MVLHSNGLESRSGEARLVAGEVMEMVHDGAAQVAEHEPEDGLENFFGCRRHAGRVSRKGMESRIIAEKKSQTQDPGTTHRNPGHPPRHYESYLNCTTTPLIGSRATRPLANKMGNKSVSKSNI